MNDSEKLPTAQLASKLQWFGQPENGVKFAPQYGTIDTGIVEIKPGGEWKTHWHEQREEYFVFQGRAIFTIGDKVLQNYK